MHGYAVQGYAITVQLGSFEGQQTFYSGPSQQYASLRGEPLGTVHRRSGHTSCGKCNARGVPQPCALQEQAAEQLCAGQPQSALRGEPLAEDAAIQDKAARAHCPLFRVQDPGIRDQQIPGHASVDEYEGAAFESRPPQVQVTLDPGELGVDPRHPAVRYSTSESLHRAVAPPRPADSPAARTCDKSPSRTG